MSSAVPGRQGLVWASRCCSTTAGWCCATAPRCVASMPDPHPGGHPRRHALPCTGKPCRPSPSAPPHPLPGVYSKTVNLPQTKFDMRANSVVREPQLQKFWEESKVYEKLSRENPGVSGG